MPMTATQASIKLLKKKNVPSNSNDSWHVANSLIKGVLAISSGPKNERKTWHAELSDKCQTVCNHAYYAMATSEGDASKLRNTLMNCTPISTENMKNAAWTHLANTTDIFQQPCW